MDEMIPATILHSRGKLNPASIDPRMHRASKFLSHDSVAKLVVIVTKPVEIFNKQRNQPKKALRRMKGMYPMHRLRAQ